jgi:cell division protease FtsH
MRSNQRIVAMWLMVGVLLIMFFVTFQNQKEQTIQNFNYSKFVDAVKSGHVAEVTFRQDSSEIVGKIRPDLVSEYGAERFTIIGNTGDEGYKLLKENGITPNYARSEGGNMWFSMLFSWLPLILIIVMFFWIVRQIQAGGGKAMSFGKSRAKLLNENKKRVTFKDVAGVNEAKDDLEEIVAFLKNPKKYTRLGGRIPKGVLLVGPPGTGKTLLARAVAGEAGVPFYSISGSDFVEMFVGVGASRVRDLFEQGKKAAPCLIFIDEIDAVGRHRGAGMGGGHDEREQTLNQLLVEMDGFESNEGVIIIAATNRPDVLDPALLRPGRFDRRVVVNKPDVAGREMILGVHTKKVPLGDNVRLDEIAKGTPGFSGADLENLVNEAALIAARADKSKVMKSDFELAKDKVLMGSERKSMVISEEDRRITAYHEAGHTLVGKKLPKLDPIHKVSIIPRGMALGVTQTLPERDELNLSKSKATNMLAFLYGGRAAEELIFEDFTTGAGNDMERATAIARSMVTEWGMSDKMGPITWEKREGPVFLGMQYNKSREYSEEIAKEIDTEVESILQKAYKTSMDILKENSTALEVLAQALLEYETIDGEEVNLIVSGADMDAVHKHRAEMAAKIEKMESASVDISQESRATQDSSDEEPEGGPIGGSGPVTV